MPCVIVLPKAAVTTRPAIKLPVALSTLLVNPLAPNPPLTAPPTAPSATPFQLKEFCVPMAMPTVWLATEPAAPDAAPAAIIP
ncbi:hypothetical protein D3C71_1876680 [compost metagenome]